MFSTLGCGRDENMTVSMVRRYLVAKLRLEHESEVYIIMHCMLKASDH